MSSASLNLHFGKRGLPQQFSAGGEPVAGSFLDHRPSTAWGMLPLFISSRDSQSARSSLGLPAFHGPSRLGECSAFPADQLFVLSLSAPSIFIMVNLSGH